MRRPRVQFTVRQIMLGVLIAALCAYGVVLKRRSDWIRAKAKYHSREWFKGLHCGHYDYPLARLKRLENKYHFALMFKYRRAAEHPWLPVEPDPPAPTLSNVTSRY
jgi:hypothetical protein